MALSASVSNLRNGLVCQCVHPHGYLEIIQVVEKLTEVLADEKSSNGKQPTSAAKILQVSPNIIIDKNISRN